ncbi:MAG: hypothetical protein H7287_02220, partial [Thermoleophilia bacterium]|nr:hypothetical protein [Thermoleophilia bacterium]
MLARPLLIALLLPLTIGVSACGDAAASRPEPAAQHSTPMPAGHAMPVSAHVAARSGLPGMPAPLEANDAYAADRPNQLSPKVVHDRSLIYVPNSESNTVQEIDPRTYRIVRNLRVGALPQHVVPSWDLRTLWVTNDIGNSLTAIDPRTGKVGRTVAVQDPYNMYFTPDGKHAIVVAEAFQRLDFRDPHTMKLQRAVHVDCKGSDHIDFTADGRRLLASCEFSGKLAVVDVATERLLGTISLPGVKGTSM